ncbi:hypothetical protein [Paraburkholderia terricola]|uniref:hypothetical protein n=1 Tax=Paraburkholderia terricola TaxID=169427 RepID=UPI003ECC2F6A
MIDLMERAGVAMNVRGQFSDPIADPKVTLGALAFANELGSALVRIKAGQQATPALVRRVTLLLAQMIRTSGRFKRSKYTGMTRTGLREYRGGQAVDRSNVDIIERFAQRLLLEWVDDQCAACDGRGVLGRGAGRGPVPEAISCDCCGGRGSICISEEYVPFAARTDGRGPMAFREYERCTSCSGRGKVLVAPVETRAGRQICTRCAGSGRRQADEAGRAQALGISLSDCKRNWARRFHDMLALLDHVDGSVSDTMRRQLRD